MRRGKVSYTTAVVRDNEKTIAKIGDKRWRQKEAKQEGNKIDVKEILTYDVVQNAKSGGPNIGCGGDSTR